MIFASDTWSGVSDEVMAAIAREARRGGPAYGSDPLTRAVERRFCEIFERDVAVYLVGSGTAANTLALSTYARPGGMVLCHREAHILVDEAGASELHGNRCLGLDGIAGKVTPETIGAALSKFSPDHVHAGQAVAVSITQLTELGAAYSPAEIAAIAALAHEHGLALHMDGARFAGAVAGLGVSPAEVTWKAGVDVLSFGGTKNGCLAAEAVVFFDPAKGRDLPYARQRLGHGFSKAWFIAAQFDAYLREDLWLNNARLANGAARRMAAAIKMSRIARLALEPDGNEVFVILSKEANERLKGAGVVYGPWSSATFPIGERPRSGELLVRFVTSFQTRASDVDRLTSLLR